MGWLDDYLRYTEEQESPTEFHFWIGMSLIAAVLGRRVWLDRRSHGVSRYRIYPGQLMVVLVGPSGTQKTTAAEIGIDAFLRKIPTVNIIADKITPEKLLKRLGSMNPQLVGTQGTSGRIIPGDAVAFLYADELSVLLSKQTYSDTMVDILTKLYNAPNHFEYDTMSGNLVALHNVCLTVVSTTTPIGLGESVTNKAHSTGYMARVIHVYSDKSQKVNPLLDIDDTEVDQPAALRMKEMGASLHKRLTEIAALRGPCVYTKDGREWYRDWYAKWRKSVESSGEGWPSRRHDHLLRVAILLRVATFGDLVLDAHCMEAAHLALCNIEDTQYKAFQYIGQSQIAKLQDKIVVTIQQNGGRIQSKPLYSRVRRFFNNIDDLKMALATLKESGVIGREMKGTAEFFFLIDGGGA